MNARMFFVSSDGVPAQAKRAACDAVYALFDAHWGLRISEQLLLRAIATAHWLIEQTGRNGPVVLRITP
jgi:hypothetical protein